MIPFSYLEEKKESKKQSSQKHKQNSVMQCT
jgi:hypothetical protein